MHGIKAMLRRVLGRRVTGASTAPAAPSSNGMAGGPEPHRCDVEAAETASIPDRCHAKPSESKRCAVPAPRVTSLHAPAKVDGIGQAPVRHRSQTGDTAQAPKLDRLRDEPLERQPVDVHAKRLLEWLQTSLWRGQPELIAAEVAAAYREMCAEQALEPQAWNRVGNALSKLIRVPGRPLKTYRRVVDHITPEPRRKRIYIIPNPPPAVAVVRLRSGTGA